MILLLQATSPFFSLDPGGIVRTVFTFGLLAASIAGTIFWIFKRGDAQAIAEAKKDLTGIGQKVDKLEEHIKLEIAALRQDLRHNAENIMKEQKSTTELIIELNRITTERQFAVKTDVEVLKKQNEMGECMEKAADTIASAIKEAKRG